MREEGGVRASWSPKPNTSRKMKKKTHKKNINSETEDFIASYTCTACTTTNKYLFAICLGKIGTAQAESFLFLFNL